MSRPREDHAPHHRTTLAEGPVCRVDHCACGMFHVAIGPMTLRFETAAAESLIATLHQAIAAARSRRDDWSENTLPSALANTSTKN